IVERLPHGIHAASVGRYLTLHGRPRQRRWLLLLCSALSLCGVHAVESATVTLTEGKGTAHSLALRLHLHGPPAYTQGWCASDLSFATEQARRQLLVTRFHCR
ncbi:hypothetical protein B0H14DRAFT_3032701, partial [Mycena olivaceomarginata]